MRRRLGVTSWIVQNGNFPFVWFLCVETKTIESSPVQVSSTSVQGIANVGLARVEAGDGADGHFGKTVLGCKMWPIDFIFRFIAYVTP